MDSSWIIYNNLFNVYSKDFYDEKNTIILQLYIYKQIIKPNHNKYHMNFRHATHHRLPSIFIMIQILRTWLQCVNKNTSRCAYDQVLQSITHMPSAHPLMNPSDENQTPIWSTTTQHESGNWKSQPPPNLLLAFHPHPNLKPENL